MQKSNYKLFIIIGCTINIIICDIVIFLIWDKTKKYLWDILIPWEYGRKESEVDKFKQEPCSTAFFLEILLAHEVFYLLISIFVYSLSILSTEKEMMTKPLGMPYT